MKKVFQSKFLPLIFSSVFLVQCGVFVGNPSDDDGTNSYGTPVDSTGTDSSMTLAVSSDSAATLQGDSVLVLPNGFEIFYGKLTFGRLKMNPDLNSHPTESEYDTRISDLESGEDSEKAEARQAKHEEVRAIEEEYDALIAAAGTNEEIIELRIAEDAARKNLEIEFAELEKELEDLKDEIDDEDTTLRVKDTFTYNLLDKTIDPEISTFTATDGSYNRIELELRPNRTEGAEDMINRAVLVEGEIEINGTDTRVEFEVRKALTLQLKASKSLSVDVDDVNELIIKFKLGKWFKGIDFTQATINNRGDIRINERDNKLIYDQIINNIRRTTEFGEDEDGDGDISTEELSGDGIDDDEEEEGEEEGEEEAS